MVFIFHILSVPRKNGMGFTKLRFSSHQLRVETGKYASSITPHHKRYCLTCNSIDIEDE